MFAVIYRFRLRPEQESTYIKAWNIVADYFIQQRGALGSCLHKSENTIWVAYSRWTDRSTRDAAWPGDGEPHVDIPTDVREAIAQIQKIKKQNIDLEQYDEICMDVVEDKLISGKI